MPVEPISILTKRWESGPRLRLPGIEIALGVQEVGIHKRRKEHAHTKRLRQLFAFDEARQAEKGAARIERAWQREHVGMEPRARLHCLAPFPLGVRAVASTQARIQVGLVVKACVVGGNQVREQPTGTLAVFPEAFGQGLEGVQRARRGVRFFLLRDALAFDVGIVFLAHVFLEARPELAEVVPKTGEVCPGRHARFGASGGGPRHREQMVDQQVRRPVGDRRLQIDGFNARGVALAGDWRRKSAPSAS